MSNRVWIGALIAAGLYGQSKEPRFEDYPIIPTVKTTPAAPKLRTAGQRRFRTVLRDSVAKGANFADHYAVVKWGCGTGCLQMAVVDAASGEIYDGPFGELSDATVYLGPNVEDDKTGIFYRRDSSLLEIRGCPNSKECGTFHFQWMGTQFKLLRRVPMKPIPGSQ